MELLLQDFKLYLKPTFVLIAVIALYTINTLIFRKIRSISSNDSIIKGVISFIILFLGMLILILTLPIEKTLKGQILSFLGIIISAGIALSSTTILGNLIAGIMNNSMNRFRNGDLIKINDYHGRVSKKSVFHTELQLEDSNFISIPNLYIANSPVKLTRKTNTVISTTVSLGYDLSHSRIEEILKKAAISAGLTDPYMYIIELGDFSVTYKIHGFLEDSSKFFSTNSLLNANVIDKLHENKIEIVSPSFMNQRRVDEKQYIPLKTEKKSATNGKDDKPEDLIFDEAIKSEKIEIKKDYIKDLDIKTEELKDKLKVTDNDAQKEKIKEKIEQNSRIKEKVLKNIEDQPKKDSSK